MDKKTTINILINAGYTAAGARKGADAGTIITTSKRELKEILPGIEPEKTVYRGKKYYIAYAN